jgi:hypothetical protein
MLHEKETNLGQPTGKNRNSGKRKISQGKSIIVTDHMPDWMQRYLASTGIEREFDISELNPTQFSVLEFASSRHVPYGDSAEFRRCIIEADMPKLVRLVRIVGMLMQTKVYLFWSRSRR